MKFLSLVLALALTLPSLSFGVRRQEFDAGLYMFKNAPYITAEELQSLSGVTSNIQTQLNNKEPKISAGTTAQYFRGDKTWQTLNKAAVGLGNVDNTSDLNKPISTATQTALDTKAPIASPTLTGDPKAPTASFGDNDTSIATTAYVRANTYPQQNDLASGVDLDTVTTTGIYHQPNNANAAAGTNYPAPYAGKLEVFSKGSMTYQTYHVYQASEAKYFRGKYNTTWSAWKKVTSDDQITDMVTSISTSSVDNAIPKFDGNTGKVIQTSSVILNDSNAMSGLNGITSSGTATLSGALNLSSNTTNTQAGSSVVITAATSNVIRLTGSGLTSIAGYAGVVSGRITYLINTTENPIIILNDSVDAPTASNRIITGTGINIDLAPGATLALIWNTTTQRHQVVGGTGGGSGSSDPMQIALLDAEKDNSSNWLLNGASISISEAYVLSGKKSYRVPRSTVGYVVSPAIPVPMWAKGKTVSISNMVFYNGESGGMTLKVWDSTNNVEIYSGDVPAQSGVILTGDKFLIPPLCDEIRVRVYNNTTSLVSELYFDNLEITGDLLKSLNIEGDYQSEILTNVGALTQTTNLAAFSSIQSIKNSEIYTKSSQGIVFLRDASVDIIYTYFYSPGAWAGSVIYLNGVSINEVSAQSNGVPNPVTLKVKKDDKITFLASGGVADASRSKIQIKATARSQVTVFPDETFSTDINPLTWAHSGQYTEATLPNSPIGTYITFKSTGATYTQTGAGERPTQADSNMRVSGVLVTGTTRGANSSSTTPSKFIFNIGKNLVVNGVYYHNSSGGASSPMGSASFAGGSTQGQVGFLSSYNPDTGLLTVDGKGLDPANTLAPYIFYSDRANYSAGYLKIKASKTGLGMANVPARYPVKLIESGSNWATVYNDGWVEQRVRGALATVNSADNMAQTISLYISMKDTSFDIVPYNTIGYNRAFIAGAVALSSSSIRVDGRNDSAASGSLHPAVRVEGWGASSVVKQYGASPAY